VDYFLCCLFWGLKIQVLKYIFYFHISPNFFPFLFLVFFIGALFHGFFFPLHFTNLTLLQIFLFLVLNYFLNTEFQKKHFIHFSFFVNKLHWWASFFFFLFPNFQFMKYRKFCWILFTKSTQNKWIYKKKPNEINFFNFLLGRKSKRKSLFFWNEVQTLFI
jgi:hypothetical protein